jgi:hypothetical protein
MIRGAASGWQARVDAENPAAPTLSSVTTHYMNDTERDATSLSAKNGKLVGAGGQLLDTTGASGIGTFNKEGAQKHIFTMDGDKAIRAADPWAEKKVTPKPDGSANLGFINHSSFTAGKAVAGAGEMRVEKGELQQVSDQSGHYKPDGEMVGQTLDQLGAMGVNMDKTSLKLTGKGAGQKPLYVSPTQFQQHGAADAEAEIRAEKAALHGQLLGAVGARQARLGLADSEGDAPIAPAPLPAAPPPPAMPHAYRNSVPAAPPVYVDSLPPAPTVYKNSPPPVYVDSLPPAPVYKNLDPSLYD